MNDKIKKFSMSAMRVKYGGHSSVSRIEKETLVACGVRRSHKTKGGQMYCLNLSIHPRILSKLGWDGREIVDLDIELPNAMLCKADPETGVQLTRSGGQSELVPARSVCRFTLYPDMRWPAKVLLAKPCTEVECDEGILAFRLPDSLLIEIQQAQG